MQFFSARIAVVCFATGALAAGGLGLLSARPRSGSVPEPAIAGNRSADAERETGTDAEDVAPACVEELQRLDEARRELSRLSVRAGVSEAVASPTGPASAWQTVPSELRPASFETGMRTVLDRLGLAELRIDCAADPCLVFGQGDREAVEALAAGLTGSDEFPGFTPVVVSRAVTRDGNEIDVLSALALEDAREGADGARDLERRLRARLGELQD